MASLVTACVFLSLSLFCCGHETLPQCASQQQLIQSEAGKQLQIQYVYQTPAGNCTNLTCLKKPGHVNDSFICDDERPYRCYPRLQSSVVDDLYNKCDDKTCSLWQVDSARGSSQNEMCVVYIYTKVSETVNPCHELSSRRFKHQVSLAPSRDNITCHSLCSIKPADKPQDGNSGVNMMWNFVDKSDRNQVEYNVISDYSSHLKNSTPLYKYYHRKVSFQLTNRNLEIRFDLTDITSIKRLWISVEYGGHFMMQCNATVPDVTPTVPTEVTETLLVYYVVGAVVAVAAITLLSLLIFVLHRRHRRLRATPKTFLSDEPSAGCLDARSQPAVPIIQTNQSQYAQVEGEQTNATHYKQWEHEQEDETRRQVEPEQARKSHYDQVEPEQARKSHYDQVEPEQARKSHYEQVEPEQARKSHYEQVEPEQARKSHYEQVEPEQARKSHYEQVEPEQSRKSHYEQVEPEQVRKSHYEQVEPEQARNSNCEQSRPGNCKQEQLEQKGKRYYKQVGHELTRQNCNELCQVPGNKKQAMTFMAGKDKDRLSNKHKADDSTTLHPGSRNNKTAKDDAGYELVDKPDDFACVESPSCFYGHLGRNQAMVREEQNVYNHPISQVTGQSVQNNGQASAQGADDVYDELHRERRMVVIGNVYGTTGRIRQLGAASD